MPDQVRHDVVGIYCSRSNNIHSRGKEALNQNEVAMICLGDNIPTMMAYADDLSDDDIFYGAHEIFFRAG